MQFNILVEVEDGSRPDEIARAIELVAARAAKTICTYGRTMNVDESIDASEVVQVILCGKSASFNRSE